AQLTHHIARRFDDRHAAREGNAAATGEKVKAERTGVADQRAHLVKGDAQLLGCHHGERRARAADIRRTRYERHAAVFTEVERGAGLSADVEPESRSDAATLIGFERGA